MGTWFAPDDIDVGGDKTCVIIVFEHMEFHEERLGVCFKFVGLQTHLDELGSKFVVVVGVHPRPSTKFGHCRFHFPDHPCIIYIYHLAYQNWNTDQVTQVSASIDMS